MNYRVGDTITPEQAMTEAIRVALSGRGFVSPNPLVGCVIVDCNHKFVASGAHRKFGQAHAEINALKNVSDPGLLTDGVMYVTLEPCSHHGKTPPCVEAIGKTSIKKVIYGTIDPNPEVAGKGIQALQALGKKVGHFTTFEKRCHELMETYLHSRSSQRPFIAVKIAASIDGKIALENGDSKWITGPDTRAHARTLRGFYDGTFIGAGTLMNDDPLLDLRETQFEGHKENRVVILDPKGKAVDFYASSRLAKVHAPDNVKILTSPAYLDKWQTTGLEVLNWDSDTQSWLNSLQQLKIMGFHSLFVEGGAFAISQFLQHSLMDRIYIYQAPKILGAGLSWSRSLKVGDIESARVLREWQYESVGSDLLITARFG